MFNFAFAFLNFVFSCSFCWNATSPLNGSVFQTSSRNSQYWTIRPFVSLTFFSHIHTFFQFQFLLTVAYKFHTCRIMLYIPLSHCKNTLLPSHTTSDLTLYWIVSHYPFIVTLDVGFCSHCEHLLPMKIETLLLLTSILINSHIYPLPLCLWIPCHPIKNFPSTSPCTSSPNCCQSRTKL